MNSILTIIGPTAVGKTKIAVEVAKKKSGEIIFLKSRLKQLTLNEQFRNFKIALNKLEYLLNTLKNNDTELSDKDFDKVVLIIYQIFQEIINNLEC